MASLVGTIDPVSGELITDDVDLNQGGYSICSPVVSYVDLGAMAVSPPTIPPSGTATADSQGLLPINGTFNYVGTGDLSQHLSTMYAARSHFPPNQAWEFSAEVFLSWSMAPDAIQPTATASGTLKLWLVENLISDSTLGPLLTTASLSVSGTRGHSGESSTIVNVTGTGGAPNSTAAIFVWNGGITSHTDGISTFMGVRNLRVTDYPPP